MKNNWLEYFTTGDLAKYNMRALKLYGLSVENTSKLKNYKYIDEYCELKIGSVIRYFILGEEDQDHLKTPVIVTDISILDGGIYIYCKSVSPRFVYYTTLMFDKHVIFQKLRKDEELILEFNSSLST